jgi:hypothetical protein
MHTLCTICTALLYGVQCTESRTDANSRDLRAHTRPSLATTTCCREQGDHSFGAVNPHSLLVQSGACNTWQLQEAGHQQDHNRSCTNMCVTHMCKPNRWPHAVCCYSKRNSVPYAAHALRSMPSPCQEALVNCKPSNVYHRKQVCKICSIDHTLRLRAAKCSTQCHDSSAGQSSCRHQFVAVIK